MQNSSLQDLAEKLGRTPHGKVSWQDCVGSQLWHGKSTVLLGTTGGKWGEAGEEEVEAREWDEIDAELAEVRVELTREAETGGDTRHTGGAQVVEIAVGWGGELEGTEADVGHLRRWHDGEGEHHTVGVLLADLGDEESSHTGTGAATEGVTELEALKTIARLGLLADNIKNRINQLSALSVVTLGPVITGASLAEDKVVGAEELTERTSTNRVHGTRLEIHEDGTGHVATTGGLVVVHVDALQLEVGVAVVGTGWVNAMLVGDNLPEFGTNLVTALASLDVYKLAHL